MMPHPNTMRRSIREAFWAISHSQKLARAASVVRYSPLLLFCDGIKVAVTMNDFFFSFLVWPGVREKLRSCVLRHSGKFPGIVFDDFSGTLCSLKRSRAGRSQRNVINDSQAMSRRRDMQTEVRLQQRAEDAHRLLGQLHGSMALEQHAWQAHFPPFYAEA